MSQKVKANIDPKLGQHEVTNQNGTIDVTYLWNGAVIGNNRLSRQGSITLGAGDADFNLQHGPINAGQHKLIEMQGGVATLTTLKEMQLFINGEVVTGQTHQLKAGDDVSVLFGPFEFQVRYTKKYPILALPFWHNLDYVFARIASLSLLGMVGLITAFYWSYHVNHQDEDDLWANLNEFQKLILEPEEEIKEKPPEELSGKEAARHKDEEGLFGKKDKPKEDKAASKDGAQTVDKDKREEDRKIVFDQLAAMGLNGPQGAVSNVFGPGGLGGGVNNALGGLAGSAMGDAGGAGGLGSRGTGGGGGGDGLGVGGLGSGTGRGTGGNGGINLGGRGKGRANVKAGRSKIIGSLSKEEINRVVRRHMAQIKHCYEKELNKSPKLQGKLLGSWTISAAGSVSKASMKQNTMGNKNVGRCVTSIIKRMRFPKPRGGGVVYVSYPFVFAPSGV